MKAADLIKQIEPLGWYEARQTGSHRIFKKDGEKKPITIPMHGKKDLKPGLLNSILKTAGLK